VQTFFQAGGLQHYFTISPVVVVVAAAAVVAATPLAAVVAAAAPLSNTIIHAKLE
jgi:hypothetical protein